MNYADQLKDRRWLDKRTEILIRDNFHCTKCASDANTNLEVHHLGYLSGRMAWQYPNDMLLTLCRICHSQEQERACAETIFLNMLKLDGFLVSDLLTFCIKRDEDHSFTQKILKYLRNG